MTGVKQILAIIVLALLATACATSPKVTGPRTLLFPLGTYRHTVTIQLKNGTLNGKPDGPHSQRFSGVVNLQKDKLTILALSPFGTTVFRLTENRTTKTVVLETEIAALKKVETQIATYLEPMQLLLSLSVPLPVSDRVTQIRTDKEGWPIEFDLAANQFTHVVLENYDANHIARAARLGTELYDLNVQVDDYAP